MDFQTKPVARRDLRKMAKHFRELFDIRGRPFPVLDALERLRDIFPGSNYIVVEDNCLPSNVMAQCTLNDACGYTIEIKESVYVRAYYGSGADLGFICHEMCHIFLFMIGYTPIVARSFPSGRIQAYRSVEWQAKALCGEVMIPFEESAGMSAKEIVQTYHVSWESAIYRLRKVSA